MAPVRRKFRSSLEAATFRIGLAVVPRLPRRLILALAWTGGMLGFLFDRRGMRIGQINLKIAFGDSKTAAERRAALRSAYITMTRTFLDVIWFGIRPEQRLVKYVELDDSMQPLLRKKNQICITAHFGNWEVIGQAMAQRGFPLHSIAMPVKNPDVDRMLIARREVTGQKIVPLKGALKTLLGVLRNDGKAAFLVDQNTPEKNGGIWVDYFGLPVPVTPAPAALAAKTGSEIFIGFCMPQKGGRYRIYATERIPPPADSGEESVHALTQQILSAIERAVSKHPDYWLWMYKRWKARKPGDHPNRYPDYGQN